MTILPSCFLMFKLCFWRTSCKRSQSCSSKWFSMCSSKPSDSITGFKDMWVTPTLAQISTISFRTTIATFRFVLLPQFLKNIKAPLFTTFKSYGNCGLGLSIANKIIETHNGSLKIENDKKRGTRVILFLPNKNE